MTFFIEYFIFGVLVIYVVKCAGIIMMRTKKDYIYAILLWPVILVGLYLEISKE